MIEEDRVRAAQRGDRRAAEALLEGRRKWVFVRSLRATRDPHAAEDVTQEVLVRAFERLPQLRQPAAFGAWLGRILARCCTDRLEQPPAEHEPAAPPRSPDLLAELPPKLAEPVRLFYLAGLTLSETAARLGLSATTVKSRLQIARRRLREEYRPMQSHRTLAGKRLAWLTAGLAGDGAERYRAALEAMTGPPPAPGLVPASNVLLVDGDGPIDHLGGGLEALRDELRYRGLDARVARSAGALVARLRRDRVDILVLGDGIAGDVWALLRAIRLDRATRSVTVVLLVDGATYREEVASRAWLAGVDCFLTKPVDRLEAADFVAQLDGQVRARDLQVLAVDHAFSEEWEEALACLAEAVERGFDHVRQWARDTAAFRPLHEREEFRALAGP